MSNRFVCESWQSTDVSDLEMAAQIGVCPMEKFRLAGVKPVDCLRNAPEDRARKLSIGVLLSLEIARKGSRDLIGSIQRTLSATFSIRPESHLMSESISTVTSCLASSREIAGVLYLLGDVC
jgi:hypothetical protein